MTLPAATPAPLPEDIPPDELGGIIDDLISIAEALRERGDEVNAGLIDNIVDQLILHLPD